MEKIDAKGSDMSELATSWKFTDEKGQIWDGTESVRTGTAKNRLLVSLRVSLRN